MSDIDIGQQIGEYKVVAILGVGGMGKVVLVRDAGGNERVLKTVRPEIRAADPKADERFRKEAEIHSRLRHSNIVRVFETFEHDGATYMAMEYLERGSLRGTLYRLKRAEAVEALLDVLDGLAYAHDRHVAHGDIKPENLLLTDEREVKLTDFGIAKAFDTVTQQAGGNTTRFVSAPYASPEQLRGGSITTKTDQYSVGVVAHEILFGSRPGPSGPRTGDRLTPWLQSMLAANPEARPDAQRAALRLRELEGETRRPWRKIAAAVVLLFALIAGTAAAVDKMVGTGPQPTPTPVATVAATVTPMEPAAVPIGIALALKGTDGANQEVFAGAQLAEAYLNEPVDAPGFEVLKPGKGLPGFHNAKIKLLEPTNRDPKRCEMDNVVDDLIARGAVGLVGSYESTFTVRAISAAAGRVVLVNGGSTVSALTEKPDGELASKPELCKGESLPDERPSDWYFGVGPNDKQAAALFFDYLDDQRRDDSSLDKVVLLGESRDFWGSRVAVDVRRLAADRGYDFEWLHYPSIVNAKQALDGKCRLVPKLQRLASRLAGSHADAVFLASYRPDAVAVAKALGELKGYTLPPLLSFGSAYTDPQFFTDIRSDDQPCGMGPYEGDITTIGRVAWAANIAQPPKLANAIAKLYHDRTGNDMTPTVALGFTATMALAEAISNAGSLDPGAIRRQMSQLVLDRDDTIMPWDGIQFDNGRFAKGHNLRARVFLQKVTNGKTADKLIWPEGS